MNKERRGRINDLLEQVQEIQAEVERLQDEEQEYYDNMPEAIQGGERGEIASAAIDNLSSAYDSLDEVIEYLEAATE